MIEGNICLEPPAVIALIGPSGSCKTQLLYNLIENKGFVKPISYTTNALCSSSHVFLSEKDFNKEEMKLRLLTFEKEMLNERLADSIANCKKGTRFLF